jgi:hypothetical protein
MSVWYNDIGRKTKGKFMVKVMSGDYVIATFFSYNEAERFLTYELDLYRYPNADIVCSDDQLAERDHE